MKYKTQISSSTSNKDNFDEGQVSADPLELFALWINDAHQAEIPEHNAIALSTVDTGGKPHVRMVLLKKFDSEGFVFFTNYNSPKAKQLSENPKAAFVLFWSLLEKQIRVEGSIQILSANASDEYFDSRPEGSKIGAWASPQSQPIPNRQYLENLKSDFEEAFQDKPIKRPDFWGGYLLKPDKIEFWQGQPDRLHNRIEYSLVEGEWRIQRLAP
ncbi:MAG: pyridoxamine 5'-phosphate oxidase [Bacteroidales bacterium]|nr:pyridoxamine 5'-phosphate oxidase [Bacteroidales bacterium]MCF8458270.1 pyridoxamine 5'-phosphate oxidase [Bacteroidales bacterium]